MTKIFIKIEYIFICIQSSKELFNHFTRNKPIEQNLVLVENHQQLHRTLFESYIDLQYIDENGSSELILSLVS